MKKLILVTSPPACGKTFVTRKLAKAMPNCVYLDKDTLIVFIVYVLLGTVGLPVFVGGTSGLGKLLGPTGGFIFSWPIAYTLLSICKGKSRSFLSYSWRSIVITIPVVYIFGVAGFMLVTGTPLWAALTAAMFPYIPGDIVKCLVAAWLATKIKI